MKWINECLREQMTEIGSTTELHKVQFRFWHVEPLLNQAADLLDRCLTDYTLERHLEERFAHLKLDYEERTRRSALETKRINTNEVQKRDGQIIQKQQDELDKFLEVGGAINDKWAHAEQLVTWGLAGAENNRANMQRYDAYIQSRSALAEKASRDLHKEWTGIDAEDQKKSFHDREDVFLILKSYIELPDGPFNLLSLRDKVGERIVNDFKQAAVRMTVAAEGLRLIYGYRDPLPDLNAKPNSEGLDDSDALPLDRAVKWIRDAISWLVGFGQHDQAFTRCLSLRAIVSPDEWSDKADELDGGVSFRFEVPPTLFTFHRYVRLRGIAAYVVGDKTGHTPWRTTVQIPRRAQFVRESGSSEVDQTFPPCHLGRVDRWDTAREPEVCGTLSLMNGSPVGVPGDEGKWEVFIQAPDHAGDHKLELEDLQLQIIAVGQPI